MINGNPGRFTPSLIVDLDLPHWALCFRPEGSRDGQQPLQNRRSAPLAAIDGEGKLYYPECAVFDGFQSVSTHTMGTRRNADPAR